MDSVLRLADSNKPSARSIYESEISQQLQRESNILKKYLKDTFEIQGMIFSDARLFVLTEGTLYQWENETAFQRNDPPKVIYFLQDYNVEIFRQYMVVLRHKEIISQVLMLYSRDVQKVKCWYESILIMQLGHQDFIQNIGKSGVVPLAKANLLCASELFQNQSHSQDQSQYGRL